MQPIRSITSLHHPLVKHLVRLRTERSYREQCRTLLFEGAKPIQEMLSSVTRLLYTPSYAAIAHLFAGEKWETTSAVIHKISGLPQPEGIVAEMAQPLFGSLERARRVLALDGLADPGNVGTLLRTAVAFGWDTAYFLPNGCDPFNDKVLRAARGAHFKLSLVHGSADTLSQWAHQSEVCAFVADLHGDPPPPIPSTQRCLLVLGNEAHGPSPEMQTFCHPLSLPMPGPMESLNVAIAGGILLYCLSSLP